MTRDLTMDLLVRHLRIILTAIGFGVGDGRRRTLTVRIGLNNLKGPGDATR